MNTDRIYKDTDGNEKTLWQMVRFEPSWAESRIRQAEQYEELLRQWFERQKKHERGDGNAPGHGHQEPWIWDTDNGSIAGHACAECALWAIAKSLTTTNAIIPG